MGKRSVGTGKDKKALRKADNEKAAQIKAQLKALNETADLLEGYAAFRRFNRNGLQAELRFFAASGLPAGLLDWALGLTRHHMQPLYEACPDWGWSDAKKRRELSEHSARYIVAYAAGAPSAAGPPSGQDRGTSAAQENASSSEANAARLAEALAAAPAAECAKPVAFAHFRLEEEAGEPVLYLYEIQVAAAAQGRGLGRFVMQLLELLAARAGLARLLLTVFHANESAVRMYRKLGYVLDEDSPGVVDPSGDHGYEIMTKWVRRPAAA